MKIVIDLQGAQTESRDRGIGRYTTALTRAFVQLATPKHEVWIAANANLGNVESIRGDFDDLVPQERIVSFAVPQRTSALDGNSQLTRAGELLRENFLRDLNADIVWCSSLFEGVADSAVASVHCLPTKTLQAITLYDLIPLSHKEILADPRIRAWYYRKLGYLQSADILLSISDYSQKDAASLLNIDPTRIVTISSAVDERFRLLDHESRNAGYQSVSKLFNLNRPFVLYIGGYDPRKNVESLIRAFAHLPRNIRGQYMLVLAGWVNPERESTLRSLIRQQGVRSEEVIWTHKVSDEQLVALYNLCDLFVFPSLQEGFGLPVLEAMACGAPVLAADATSLPEVVAREDMLFSPTDVAALARKMTAVLSDRALAEDYRRHGLERARFFSWQASARRALDVFESRVSGWREPTVRAANRGGIRPKLAYVSPLPPERTGIANYSAELLPALEHHYDIEVVVDQTAVTDPWVSANYPVRDAVWFRAHAQRFDRVLYQFGNSHFHNYQLSLMVDIPGTVVMHDSFIGDLSAWRAAQTGNSQGYRQRLYYAHGYKALIDDKIEGRNSTVENYPSNREMLEYAIGVIVHSQYAINKINYFYSNLSSKTAVKIPILRRGLAQTRDSARQLLGIKTDDFVVCSFGFITSQKLSQRLLSAWLVSALAKDVRCHLVFVGEDIAGDYGDHLRNIIRNSKAVDRIRITGFASDEDYNAWLQTADIAVQLRTRSRGESSSAVLDCMANGAVVIANANGTFAEIDPQAVCLLPDPFNDIDLVHALEDLFSNPQKRRAYSSRARQVIDEWHDPMAVAGQYREAIENFSEQHFLAHEQQLLRYVADTGSFADAQLWDIARAARSNRCDQFIRTLFIDVTAVCHHDLKTGIQRTTRSIARELLYGSDQRLRVELVRFHEGRYVYARAYACYLLGLEDLDLPEENNIEISSGDIFFGLDLVPYILKDNCSPFQAWRDRGISVYFFLYDLLPAWKPEFFPKNSVPEYLVWLERVALYADGVISISRAVAEEFLNWLDASEIQRNRPLHIGYSHLGAELDEVQHESKNLNISINSVVEIASNRIHFMPSLLMVGTIEPRKGHKLALKAFERLWRTGHELNLVIVGKLGWDMDAFAEQLRSHPEQGKRLFWFTGISDHELATLYGAVSALLAASEGEGFGLPLIEAAMHGVPIIARDLPVFREVAGSHAYYFSDDGSAEGLSQAILDWLALSHAGKAPSSKQMPHLTWQESAKTVQAMLTDSEHPHWLYRW
jgi:glycosyltransferase involved in cell wall biosynthesis